MGILVHPPGRLGESTRPTHPRVDQGKLLYVSGKHRKSTLSFQSFSEQVQGIGSAKLKRAHSQSG
jgi:hypothetical protein